MPGSARRSPRPSGPRRPRGSWSSPAVSLNHGFVLESTAEIALRVAHRQRHHRRAGLLDPGHAQDAEPAAQHHRSAGAEDRRPCGARAARHRPLHRAGAAYGQRRRAGVPGHRVRGQQARPARGPALRPHRPVGPAFPVRRRGATHPAQDGRLGLAEVQGPGPQGGQGDRRPADPALRRPQGVEGTRLRPGHPLAAGVGGRLPVHRDAGPARGDRGGQAGHGAVGPDGPADLWRRRLRQDRDRGPGGVQGGAGR